MLSVCVAVHADLIAVVPFHFILTTIFVCVDLSCVGVVFVVVVCVGISGVLLCIESVFFFLFLSLFQFPFCRYFCIPSSVPLNLSAFSLPFFKLLASDSDRFSLHFKSTCYIHLCHY